MAELEQTMSTIAVAASTPRMSRTFICHLGSRLPHQARDALPQIHGSSPVYSVAESQFADQCPDLWQLSAR
jgi:hypothetical protein